MKSPRNINVETTGTYGIQACERRMRERQDRQEEREEHDGDRKRSAALRFGGCLRCDEE
jgi:hypothetical protein